MIKQTLWGFFGGGELVKSQLYKLNLQLEFLQLPKGSFMHKKLNAVPEC